MFQKSDPKVDEKLEELGSLEYIVFSVKYQMIQPYICKQY